MDEKKKPGPEEARLQIAVPWEEAIARTLRAPKPKPEPKSEDKKKTGRE